MNDGNIDPKQFQHVFVCINSLNSNVGGTAFASKDRRRTPDGQQEDAARGRQEQDEDNRRTTPRHGVTRGVAQDCGQCVLFS